MKNNTYKERRSLFFATAGILALSFWVVSGTSCSGSSSSRSTGSSSANSVQSAPSSTQSPGGIQAPPGTPLTNGAAAIGISSPYTVDATVMTTSEITADLVDLGAQWARMTDGQLTTNGASAIGRNISVLAIVPKTGISTSLVTQYSQWVKYWEIENEPDASVSVGGMTAPDYVALLQSVSKEIRGLCPDCKIVLGGLKDGTGVTSTSQGPAFLSEILSLGASTYFDVFNYHTQGMADDYRSIANDVSVYQAVLNAYSAGTKTVWITEIATYDGTPEGTSFPTQTERDQAGGLVKRYVSALRNGVTGMFWSGLVDQSGNVATYFNHVGLIHNPLNQTGATTPTKKLSYYTYKKMVEQLKNAHVDSAVLEAAPLYVYRATNGANTLYIAWCDTCTQTSKKTVTLTGVTGATATITEAVPNAASGIDVTNYLTSFTTATAPVVNSSLTLNLGENPVYVSIQ